MNVYGRENLAANATVAVNVSGTAPPPSANNGADTGAGQGREGQDAQGGSTGVNIQQVPGRLDVLKWPLVAGFVGVFAVGAFLLARKPVAVTVATYNDSADYSSIPVAGNAKVSTPSTPVGTPLENVNAAVTTGLDYLKEQLFRLELRHQAGTISDAEYASERARAEKVLRDLVRG